MGKAIRKSTLFNSVLEQETEYHDYYCNNGSNVLNLSWNDMVRESRLLDGKGYRHIHNSVLDQQVVHEYANRLCVLSGESYDRVFFANSGSDAIESAIKIAKMYYNNRGEAKRKKIITARHCFHGNTITGLSISDAGPRNHLYNDIIHKENVLHVDLASEELYTLTSPDEVLCVVAEPYQIHTKYSEEHYDYARLHAFCKQNGIMLIIDEIYTGGGKISTQNENYWGWQDRVRHLPPDMIVCGKAITSGLFPLSAVIIDAHVSRQLQKCVFEHSFTYANHGLGCAVGLFVLDHIENHGIIAQNITTAKHITDVVSKVGFQSDRYKIKSNGLFVSVACGTAKNASEIQRKCLDRGFVFGQTFVVPGTLLMCPYFDMTIEEVDTGIHVLVSEVNKHGD